jgi:hypothetical protein
MVNKETPPYSGSRVYLNTGEEASYMRKPASQKTQPMSPEEMRPAVHPDSMKTGIA